MRADLTGFESDPVTLAAEELPSLPVWLTVVDGLVVHRSDTPVLDLTRGRITVAPAG